MNHHVYHMVPKNFFGDTLYPLNRLKSINKDIYDAQRAKYEDHPYRQTLPFRKIPKLNCLWNDVLHFCPVNPKIIYREWVKLGDEISPEIEWFKIPVENLSSSHVGVFHCRPENWSIEREHELEDEYSLLNIEDYQERTQLRPETIDWYRSWIAEKRRGAFFMYIPHILAKGDVNVANATTFKWGEPL